MRSKARNIGYILDSKDLSKNSRHKKLYGPNELMEQPRVGKLTGQLTGQMVKLTGQSGQNRSRKFF